MVPRSYGKLWLMQQIVLLHKVSHITDDMKEGLTSNEDGLRPVMKTIALEATKLLNHESSQMYSLRVIEDLLDQGEWCSDGK
jgi:hypothetical protein